MSRWTEWGHGDDVDDDDDDDDEEDDDYDDECIRHGGGLCIEAQVFC